MSVWKRLLKSWQSANVVYVAMRQQYKAQLACSNFSPKTLKQRVCVFLPRNAGINQQKIGLKLQQEYVRLDLQSKCSSGYV